MSTEADSLIHRWHFIHQDSACLELVVSWTFVPVRILSVVNVFALLGFIYLKINKYSTSWLR